MAHSRDALVHAEYGFLNEAGLRDAAGAPVDFRLRLFYGEALVDAVFIDPSFCGQSASKVALQCVQRQKALKGGLCRATFVCKA